MMDKITTIIVEDHELVTIGVKSKLSHYKDIDVLGTATNGEEAIELVKEHKPDVVIMDITLPGMSGIAATKIITDNFPECKVLYLTSHIDEESIIKGFEVGGCGYLPKTYKSEELVEAIRTVYTGKRYLKGIVSEIFLSSYFKSKQEQEIKEKVPLSKREIEVIKTLTTGLSNKQIADKLNISLRTVEVHKGNIMRKLKLFSTAELVIYAIKNKIVDVNTL
ncbi:MAG: response regulator transcription factor [Bacteroidia bacterium]|nr:response regulator transcription factor [Bacteroidia bacterium]